MSYSDWLLEASEEAGMLEELRQQKAQRLRETVAEEAWHERRHAEKQAKDCYTTVEECDDCNDCNPVREKASTCQHCGAELPHDLAFQIKHLGTCKGRA